MATATGQRIVFEYELPSGPFNHMMISARKPADRGFVFVTDTGSYALYQAINGGVYIEIGGKSDEARENTVETHLTNLPIIATAEVTITGNKWRIEVTEAPPTASMVGVDPRRHDMDYVSELPLHFSITVHHYGGDTRAGTFVTRELRGAVADPPADEGEGAAPPPPADEEDGAAPPADNGDGDAPPADEGEGAAPPPPADEEDGAAPPADNGDGDAPPADDGDGGALTNVDAGDKPDRLTPPEGEGAAPPANDGDGGDPEQQEVDQPDPEQEKSILQRYIDLANTPPDDGGRSRLQELITNGDLTGRMDAGDLSIGGGVDLPASDDGAHRSSYHLYYDADDGSYFLRFDDDRTADLSISATAPQVDAALEGLNGITSAAVTGEPGDFTIALIADEPHVLQWGDANLGGDGGLDYLMG